MYACFYRLAYAFSRIYNRYIAFRYGGAPKHEPHRRYFLKDEPVSDQTHVPEGRVYIEEWVDNHGHKKMIVKYGGDVLPALCESPFEMPAKCPWVWIGDRETEIDLTRTFSRFLVPGNVLKPELIDKIVHVTDLIYIESGTFNEVKFPSNGITIEADVE